MKTLLVLGIAVISIIGLLLMTALASRTLIPVQKIHARKGMEKSHPPNIDPKPCPSGNCHKNAGLSPAVLDPDYGKNGSKVVSDVHTSGREKTHPAPPNPTPTPTPTPTSIPVEPVPFHPPHITPHYRHHKFGPGGQQFVQQQRHH